jgi:DNA-directed RNA polymerase specialized sigma24 family protein
MQDYSESLETWTPLVKHAASEYCLHANTLGSYEDLVQEGLLAIWRVARRYPEKDEWELKKLFKTAMRNAFKNVRSRLYQKNHRVHMYTIDLDSLAYWDNEETDYTGDRYMLPDQLKDDGGFGEFFFEQSVEELRSMLTPVASASVSLLNRPTRELIEIVKADYDRREGSRTAATYRIMKKHLAEFFGITQFDMSSIIREVKLTLELNPVLG